MPNRVVLAFLGCVGLAACVNAPASVVPQPLRATEPTSWTANRGFKLSEALALLEFCIALDYGKTGYVGDIPRPNNAAGWKEIFPKNSVLPVNDDPQPLGPYANAWKLYQRGTENVFAIAIRGTIAGIPSAFEDILASSTPAKVQIEAQPHEILRFVLAETPGAETHLGFTYGAAALLFDQNVGILTILQRKKNIIPDGSKIFITGHSQGAAVATLVHAFLHYAINSDTVSDENPHYSLRDRRLQLKSYFFAQPKPGNWQFAMDFARITAGNATSFVVNNDVDWVPQAPLSIEFLDEPFHDLAQTGRSTEAGVRKALNTMLVGGTIGLLQGVRAAESAFAEDVTVADLWASFKGRIPGAYLEYATVPGGTRRGISINYVSAGNQVPVFGSSAPSEELKSQAPPGSPDWMLQHHGTTYRLLLESPERNGGPPWSVLSEYSYPMSSR